MQDFIIADWKDTEGLVEQFSSALETAGIHVYPDPGSEGSDSYGFILSDKDLSEEELLRVSEEYWGATLVDENGDPVEEFEEEEGEDDDFNFDVEKDGPDSLNENFGGPLGKGESDFERAAEIDAATDDACPSCGTPFEDWELVDGLWTCPGCGYEVSVDEF